MKRDLNKDEKAICAKQISFLLEENEELDYEVSELTLKLERGLAYSIAKLKKQYTDELKNKKNKLKSNQEVVKGLNEQIKKGVEVKIKQVDKPVYSDVTPTYTG